ncbi:unnamed protein product [Diatraea saccharalis]|uniref:Glucose-methanol-choline oxidoreductase N-terminal domain-containing protein n=1 Tax=Diatraea saccharalis TaxID=40085 RepID=A0A9P0G0I3_9NEOP|nr:unnamed protein product [Diatraea saccharalis]
MRWILLYIYITMANAMDRINLFDFWTDLFRPLPRNPREGFMPDYTPLDQEEFDFVIVGAGSAGCVLANRLTELQNWRVLLIEAGGNENFFSDIPIFASFLSMTPMNWMYSSEPEEKACKGLRGNVCFLPRGKVLGGSSVLNFLIYQRGHPDDYDDWAKMGNNGWSYSEVLPYFKKSENIKINSLRNSTYHGRGGYLDIEYAPFNCPLEQLFKKAGEELGYEWRDPNGEQVIGFSKPQATMRNGRRCSTSKAFLEPIRYRSNLKVSKHTIVDKILIDPLTKTAYGVELIKEKKRLKVRALKEVILAAGSIGSAQLLMVSGIGPEEHLREMKIEPVVNLPVGYNLQDHVTFSGNAFIVNDSSLTMNDMVAASPLSAIAYLTGRGPLTLPGGAAGLAFVRSAFATDDHSTTRPDIELVMGSGSLAGDLLGILRSLLGVTDQWYYRVYSSLPMNVRQSTFALNPVLIRPRSIGRIKLRSSNFSDHPSILMNYFDDPKDLKALVNGMRLIQQVIGTSPFQKYETRLHDVPFPGCEDLLFDSDQYWECAIMQTAITLDHQVITIFIFFVLKS